VIQLGPPPQIKPGRKATACRWYGRHESAAFRALVNDPEAEARARVRAMKDKT
jgi:hypothetical protein